MKDKNKRRLTVYLGDSDSVRTLVNDWDPVGLIECGAPEDEYDGLVARLLSLLYRTTTVEELTCFLIDHVAQHFAYDLPVVKVRDFSSRLLIWFGTKSLWKNESRLVKVLVTKAVSELGNFENYHGFTSQSIHEALVEPTKVLVDPDDLENEPYYMWIVLQEKKDPKQGYVIVYDIECDDWGVAEYLPKGQYALVIWAETLADALEGM